GKAIDVQNIKRNVIPERSAKPSGKKVPRGQGCAEVGVNGKQELIVLQDRVDREIAECGRGQIKYRRSAGINIIAYPRIQLGSLVVRVQAGGANGLARGIGPVGRFGHDRPMLLVGVQHEFGLDAKPETNRLSVRVGHALAGLALVVQRQVSQGQSGSDRQVYANPSLRTPVICVWGVDAFVVCGPAGILLSVSSCADVSTPTSKRTYLALPALNSVMPPLSSSVTGPDDAEVLYTMLVGLLTQP